MDDLIVLILTLIIFVAGAVGQIKKKKTPQSVTGENPKTDNFWDLLDEENDLAVNQFSPVNQEIKPESYREEYVSTEPENYKFSPGNEGGSVIPSDTKKEKQKDTHIKKPLREEFSLRKAVIYSEILNRKYV